MLSAIWHNWPILLVAALAVVLLGIIALLSKYVRLMLNIIRDTPPPLLMGPFDFSRIEGRHVNFRAFDGTSLRGMFLTPDSLPPDFPRRLPGPPRPIRRPTDRRHQLTADLRGVIVFCHEYGSDMYSCIRYCQPLLEAGFAIFSFDFRSHGHSSSLPGYQPRLWCTDKEVADCLGALALVQSEIKDRRLDLDIGLFGISRGAGAAILAAAQMHAILPVKAVIADSAFSTDTTLEWSMKKWVHIFARVRFVYQHHHPAFWHFLRWLLLKFARVRFHCSFPSVHKNIRKFKKTAVFFIHGDKDSYIKPQHTRALFARARRPRYLWIVPDAKHNQSAQVDPERYAARTVAFFEKHLNDCPADQLDLTEPYRDEVTAFFARDNKACRPRPASKAQSHDRSQNHRLPRRPQRRPSAPSVPPDPAPLPHDPADPAPPYSTPSSRK